MTPETQKVELVLRHLAPASLDEIAREARMTRWDTFTHLIRLEDLGKATVVERLWTNQRCLDIVMRDKRRIYDREHGPRIRERKR